MMKYFVVLALCLSCATDEKSRFRKDEYQTYTKNFSYRLTKKEALEDYLTGGLEEPSVECELGRFEKSLNYFQNNYTKHNKKPAYWVKAAVCAQREGKEELSLFLYKKAQLLFAEERNSALEINLAVYFHSLQNYGLAYQQYIKALKVESENLLLKVNFSRLLIKIGHFNEALELLRGIYQIAAYDNEVLHLLGTTLLLLEKYELAVKTYEQVSENDAKRRDIAINFALANWLNGEGSKAISIMNNSDKSLNPQLEKRFQRIMSKIKS